MRTALMATRSGPSEPTEAELVGVDVDGDVVRLELDDGCVVVRGRSELLLEVGTAGADSVRVPLLLGGALEFERRELLLAVAA